MNDQQKTHVSSVSWPNLRVKDAARKRAKSLGLTLSSYINHLITKDLESGGDFVLRQIRIVGDEEALLDKDAGADGWPKPTMENKGIPDNQS